MSRAEKPTVSNFAVTVQNAIFSYVGASAFRRREDTKFLNRVTEIVNRNLKSGVVNMSFIARQMGISESSLRRRVIAVTGESLKTYIQAIQMQRACRLLDEGFPINAVAYECGFSDPSSLTRTFKRVFSVTPTQYRAQSSDE